MNTDLFCGCGWKAKTQRGLAIHREKNWCGKGDLPSRSYPVSSKIRSGNNKTAETRTSTKKRRPPKMRSKRGGGIPRTETPPKKVTGSTSPRSEDNSHLHRTTEEPLVPVSPARKALVADAVKKWVDELVDRSGHNRLLYYRHLKTGTLDLKDAHPATLDRMLQGRKVRITQLFRDTESQIDAMRRARAIEAKGRENDEERGIQTLHIAFGLATWSPKLSEGTSSLGTAIPNAPVVIQTIQLHSTGYRGGDYELVLDNDPELNPALLHVLASQFQIKLDSKSVLGDQTLSKSERQAAVDRLKARCGTEPSFDVKASIIIGNFSYTKLPMVEDIEQNAEAIEQDTLLAAIAGDEQARDELREQQSSMDLDSLVPVPPPKNEFLVLDADASQSWAIEAVQTGANLVIEGPPGTGKSQTIANLIAVSVARGRSVLFVAEKRAAIEAVTKRLEETDLEHMVLDIHGGTSDKKRVANDLSKALDAAGTALEPDVKKIHRDLNRRREELESYQEQLHREIEPWGISAFQIQNRLLELTQTYKLNIRFDRHTLSSLSGSVIEQARENLRSFVERGGLQIAYASKKGAVDDSSVFASIFASETLVDSVALEGALKALDRISLTSIPEFNRLFGQTCSSLHLQPPKSIEDAGRYVSLLHDIEFINKKFSKDLWITHNQVDLDSFAYALGAARSWTRLFRGLFSKTYRSARTVVRGLASDTDIEDKDLLDLVEKAADIYRRWTLIATLGSTPSSWPQLDELGELGDAYVELSEATESLELAFGLRLLLKDLNDLQELQTTVNVIESGRSNLLKYPNLHALHRSLISIGLESVIDAAHSQSLNDESAAMALEHTWLSSVLDVLWIDLTSLSRFDRDSHDTTVTEFQIADQKHIGVGAKRVKRAWAATSVGARDSNPHESAILSAQASLAPGSRKRWPLRKLFQEAGNILTKVKPCWVMSPLVVAQVLPARKCFDLVIFDEASQITPADAVSSLIRGRQAVVAGDTKQLPPTKFFASTAATDLDDDPDLNDDLTKTLNAQVRRGQTIALVDGQESLLDQMKALLPPPHGTKTLNWHYRSKCESLIAFSNAQEELYDWRLTTFPNAGVGNCVRHVLAPFTSGVEEASASADAEVQEVVNLVIQHAEKQPEQSLGVIALGVTHANQIEEQLRKELESKRNLEKFFEKSGPEPFFIKNLERVQGDERDAIILTTGYSKTKDGRMRYNFGPINQEGGYRRLNVAVTRAKLSMTMVSSFSSTEMDDEKLNTIGPRMLKDYLVYAESGGTNLGRNSRVKPQMNAFERDIYEALTNAGLRLTPQYGDSGYWIDFAAMHPDRPGEPILAIEADGAMYHSSASARDRDRLRQTQLEKLGWRFHRIWSTAWFRNKEQEIDRLVQVYEDTLNNLTGPHGEQEGSNNTIDASVPLDPSMDHVDSYVPQPDRPRDLPFLMPVEDVFSIKSRGTVVTGRVEQGTVDVGDQIEIIGIKKTSQTVVTGVLMGNKTLDSAEPGDAVGVILRGVEREDIERGQVLAAPGSITPHTEAHAQVTEFGLSESTPEREPWPAVIRGRPIAFYSQAQLRSVVEWVKSDGRLRTEDELIGEIMHHLGFKRRGPRIIAAIQAVIQ